MGDKRMTGCYFLTDLTTDSTVEVILSRTSLRPSIFLTKAKTTSPILAIAMYLIALNIKLFIIILSFMCSVIVMANLSYAKDLGVHGHTFDIQEPDIVQTIQTRLRSLEQTGQLGHLQDKLVQQTKKRILRPQPVLNVSRTIAPRSWVYDPSITLSEDLKDQHGRVFQRAGTKVNPLQYRTMTQPFVFFDGDDADQVAWVEHHYIYHAKPAKLILVGGAPFDWMEKWGREVYFDQQGRLTQKFKIRNVPATICQHGQYLQIEEVACGLPSQPLTTRRNK